MAWGTANLPEVYVKYAHRELVRRLRALSFANRAYLGAAQRGGKSVEILKANTSAIQANAVTRNAQVSDADEVTSSKDTMLLDKIRDNYAFMDGDDMFDLRQVSGVWGDVLRAQADRLAQRIDTDVWQYILGDPAVASNEGTIVDANVRFATRLNFGSASKYVSRATGVETGQGTDDALVLQALDGIADHATIAGFLGGTTVPDETFTVLLPSTLLPSYAKAVRDENISDAYNERFFEGPGADRMGIVGQFRGMQVRVYMPTITIDSVTYGTQYTQGGKQQHTLIAGRREALAFATSYQALERGPLGIHPVAAGGSVQTRWGRYAYARLRHGELVEEPGYGFVAFVRAQA